MPCLQKSVLCPVPVAPNTVLEPSCCPAVVWSLPRGRSWGTPVSQPPGGISLRKVPGVGCRALGHPGCWHMGVALCPSRLDPSTCPCVGAGGCGGCFFPWLWGEEAVPWKALPWGDSLGTVTGGPTLPLAGFGIPCTLLAPNPTLSPCCRLVSGAACAHVPASLNTDTRLGSPCSGSVGLL